MKKLLALDDREWYYVFAPNDNGKIIQVEYVGEQVNIEVVPESDVGPGDELYVPMLCVKSGKEDK